MGSTFSHQLPHRAARIGTAADHAESYHDDALANALCEALVDVWQRLRLPLKQRAFAAE